MTPSNLVLLGYILLIVPAMIVGFVFARRKMFVPYHKYTMTTITLVNWLLILLLMFVTYRRDVLPQVPQNLGVPAVLIPTLHLIPGLIAQLLATYLVIRMWFEKQLPGWFKVKRIKRYMRVTLGLWLLTAVLGVLTWAVINQGFLAAPAAAVNVAPGSTVVRLVAGNQFDPAELTIPTGTTVQFVNADTRSHTVTADDGSFASGTMKPGATFSFTFNQPGDVSYYCEFHGSQGHVGMAAVLHVVGNPVSAPTAVATETPTAAATPSSASTAASTSEAGAGQVFTVVMSDNAFEPKDLTIPVGSTVHFVNQGKHEHTVTADDSSFDSDQVKAGGSYDHTFSAPGNVPLYCQNHGGPGGDGMAMVIHVVAAGAAATSAATNAPTSAATVTPPPPTVAAAATPVFSAQVEAALRPLVVSADDTPGKTPYAVGMQGQMGILAAQGAIVTDALSKAHYEDAQAAAEAILNVIDGGTGKDRDGDGKINQPGDSYGLKQYIFSVNEAADTLQGATNTADPLHKVAVDMQSAGPGALTDLQSVTQQAQALLDAKTLVDARNVEPLLTASIGKLQADLLKITGGIPAIPGSQFTPVPPGR